MSAHPPQPATTLAIVGLGCRFPGADTPDAFWHLLRSTHSQLGAMPPERRSALGAAASEPVPGAFLDDVHAFDGDYFETAPREAAALDPQQRLILQTVALALEDAAIGRRELARGVTGVFTGVSAHDHSILTWAAPGAADRHAASGTANGLSANRVSYWLKANGPSVAFDSACSSGLVAVHYARQSLISHECDIAICAAASVLLLPGVTASLQAAGIVSASGRCRPFAEQADGYLRGEGAGAVVLCRLQDALQRGHRIYAVLRGSAINHNGASNGLCAPNLNAQAEVISRAHAAAGTAPGRCSYVETMAASRELADTMELKALDATVGRHRADGDFCRIGSLKGHIGHLEAAAGIAGLIKSALALYHGELPPTLGSEPPNRYLLRATTRLKLVTHSEPLKRGPDDVIGVSAFGFGGANAHAVLGAAPARALPRDAVDTAEARERSPSWVLTFSACSADALRRLRVAYIDCLRRGDGGVGDLCYTSNTSRTDWPLRAAVAGSSRAELVAQLEGDADDSVLPALSGVPVALVFGRFGSSDTAALRTAYEQYAVLRSAVAAVATTGDSWHTAALSGAQDLHAVVSWPVAFGAMWRQWVPGIQHLAACGAGIYAAAVHAGIFDAALAQQLWQLQCAADRGAAAAEHDRLVVAALAREPNAEAAPVEIPAELRDCGFWREAARRGCAGLDTIALPPPALPCIAVGNVPSLAPARAGESIATTLARLFRSHVELRWNEVHRDTGRCRVTLPSYPFTATVSAADSILVLPSAVFAAAADRDEIQSENEQLAAELDQILGRYGF